MKSGVTSEAQAPDIFPNSTERLAAKKGATRAVASAFTFVPRHAYLPLLSRMQDKH